MNKFNFIKTLLESIQGNFNRYDESDIKEFLDMPLNHDLSLDDVEEFASFHGLPSSDSEVSEQFFAQHAATYDENERWNDIDWIRHDYSIYVDNLNRDGYLHDLQANEYDISDRDIRHAEHHAERHEL